MKKIIKFAAVALSALLLCGCLPEGTVTDTDNGTETRQSVTSPQPLETLAPIDSPDDTGEAQTKGEDQTENNETNPADTDKPETHGDVTEPVTTKEETEAVTEKRNDAPDGAAVSFVFCGDNLCHDAVINNAKRYAEGTGKEYNFLPIYDAVADIIKKADCAVINQESQIAGDASAIKGYPNFNTPAQMGDDLITLGYDVITLANNHMLDNKTKGYQNCINYWKTKDVLTVGAYENKADYDNIRTIDVNGVRVAFLAYTEMINSDRRADGLITPLLDENTVKRQMKLAKEKADVVIVLPHWGKEDSFDVTKTQKKYAELFAECGADAVVGMHSHVTGKIEYIERPDGKKMLCAYSLGNFVSTMEYARDMVGLILQFDVVKEDNGFAVKNAGVIPTVTYFVYTSSMKLEDRTDLKLYLLSDFTDELAEKHAYNYIEKKQIRLAELKKFVTDYVDRQFLPDYLK
ncbi:MAG: CapA family protein [Clostridia bacterium]|nr:CapA family protein [Clostridia bacterium]